MAHGSVDRHPADSYGARAEFLTAILGLSLEQDEAGNERTAHLSLIAKGLSEWPRFNKATRNNDPT